MMNRVILFLTLAALPAFAGEMTPIQEVFEPVGAFDVEHFGKVAVIQWAPEESAPIGVTQEQAEAYKANNRKQIELLIRQAAAHGAEMIITPEFAIQGYPDIPELPPEEDEYRNREDIRPYVEPVPGPSTEYFAHLAKELRIYLHIGFAEVDLASDRYFNTVVAFGPQGQILARYRKINLYQLENQFLSPGQDIAIYDSPFGRVGILICADIYSWNPLSRYREAKVPVLALSTSWAMMNTGMITFAGAARSLKAHVLAANQPYFPDSGVINPDGSTQSHIRQSSGIAYGYLPRIKTPPGALKKF